MERSAYQKMAECQTRHWWFRGRRKIINSFLARLVLPAGATIMEAGCGAGGNLEMLGQYGAVSAFEPDEYARSLIKENSGVHVEVGSLPGPIPFSDPFDLVVAFDVLEHVEDDRAAARALWGYTKPGGRALFTVPAFPFLWSGHDLSNHHYRRYTRASFRKLLEDAGYQVEFISYYNTLLFPLIAPMRILSRFMRPDADNHCAMPRYNNLNGLLAGIFGVERHLLRLTALPFGVSLIAHCRKVE